MRESISEEDIVRKRRPCFIKVTATSQNHGSFVIENNITFGLNTSTKHSCLFDQLKQNHQTSRRTTAK